MTAISDKLIHPGTTIKSAMEKLNTLPNTTTLFVVDEDGKVRGTLTDGDIRRGLLKGLTLESLVENIMHRDFRYLKNGNYYNDQVEEFRKLNIKTIPLLDNDRKLLEVFDLTRLKNILPVDAVIMAGGKGERLSPLTNTVPKPLLPVGDRPIIEHNVDRISAYGIKNIFISLNYLGQMIKDHFRDGRSKQVSINYIEEEVPLGTIGAVSKITGFRHDNVLIMNSDLLTNIDFADFYKEFITQKAQIAVATIPYKVTVPYAVIETSENDVKALKEKPTYTYYSNAGIYLVKRDLLNRIPRNSFHNATEFIDQALKDNLRIISYPLLEYWLDIGRHEDYLKAQEDFRHLKF
jgi:dTDP-glucose pyrophosphorylase